jgi:hypothetical protein
MSEEKRRFFYWGGERVIDHLLETCKIKPVPGQRAKTRKSTQLGKFIVDGKHMEVISRGMGGFNVFCDDPLAITTVWRVFRTAEKYLDSQYEHRDIIRPTLPQETYDLIQSVVFDFYSAIDAFKTTKGFGNVGIILTGPPGVGKSEMMRWIREKSNLEYNRGSFQLGLAELRKILADGTPLNTENSLIFIDDIDANILRDRKETHNPLTSQFLTCLDGLDKREGRVIIVSTNERLDNVDPALTRPGRFEHTIRFNYPNLDLIQKFCNENGVKLDAKLFTDWSFARIDMFLAKFKVAEFLHNTSLNVFYEKFIYEMGATDPTVEAQGYEE